VRTAVDVVDDLLPDENRQTFGETQYAHGPRLAKLCLNRGIDPSDQHPVNLLEDGRNVGAPDPSCRLDDIGVIVVREHAHGLAAEREQVFYGADFAGFGLQFAANARRRRNSLVAQPLDRDLVGQALGDQVVQGQLNHRCDHRRALSRRASQQALLGKQLKSLPHGVAA
jgi:hypothetical protein